jgi:hypothetical protein
MTKLRGWMFVVSALCAGSMLVGAIGPWYSFPSPFGRRVDGLSPMNLNDGWFVLITSIASLIVLALLLWYQSRLIAFLLVAIAVSDTFVAVRSTSEALNNSNGILWGLYVLLGSAILFAMMALLLFASITKHIREDNDRRVVEKPET